MRRSLQIIALLAGLLAVLYLVEGVRYPRGSAAQPGPGLYPLLVGGLLLVASAGLALESVLSTRQDAVEWPAGPARWRVQVLVGAIAGYVILLPRLGHPAAGSLVTIVVLHLMGLRAWPLKVALALALGLGSYYLFAGVLDVPLPVSPWQ